MKQTFTQLTAFALSIMSAFGQINQTFETVSNLTTLTNDCWQFNDVLSSTENRLNGANSLEVLTTTTTSHTASIITPCANLSNGSVISFKYKPSNKLSTSAARTMVIRLQGLAVSDRTQLLWAVADNENGNYFEIERSYDGKEFKTIGIVTTTQKPGDEVYRYKNELPIATYYRLKMVSKSNTFSYSNVVFIKKQPVSTNLITLLQNPVKKSLRFTFLAEKNESADITIYSMAGIKVYQTQFTAFKGNNNVTTTLEKLVSKAAYILEIKTIDGRSIIKFLKD